MPARPRYRPHSSPILVSPLRSCHNLAFTISPLRPARSGGRRRPPVFWNASSARSPLVPDSGSSIQGEPRRNRRRWTTTPGNGHRDRLLITPGVDQQGVSHFEQEAHEPRRLALPWDQVADPDRAGRGRCGGGIARGWLDSCRSPTPGWSVLTSPAGRTRISGQNARNRKNPKVGDPWAPKDSSACPCGGGVGVIK